MPAPPSRNTHRIGILVDPRLSRERSNLLTRTINALRHIAEIYLLPGSANEDEIIEKLKANPCHLVLVPWYRYLYWSRVEAFFGATRTRGPTFAGYHCDELTTTDIGPYSDQLRAILFDFATLSTLEATMLCRALLHDSRRSGIQPLLKAATPVYCENWYAAQGLGNRLDAIFSIPELASALASFGPGGPARASAIRILIVALWSLIYEHGPGKADFSQATSNTPRAAFQIAADEQAILLRLSFAMPGWSPKSSVSAFWPLGGHPSTPFQILLRYSDFVRVHTIADSPIVELVAGLLPSASSEKTHGGVHTIWIEPIAAQLVTESPFELPGPNSPRLRILPNAPAFNQKIRQADNSELRAKDRFVSNAVADIRQLRSKLAQREELIRDLKSGGVSTAPPLPPPDAETLLEAFQERYFEARYQIRQIEVQIAELETRQASPEEMESLRQKMEALSSRENAWIKQLLKTIQIYRDSKKKPPI